jgi:signal peptidase II
LKKRQWVIPLIAVAVILIDQLSKYLVTTNLPLYGSWSPLPGPDPFFRIIYVYNTGAAFGLFKDLGPIFTLIAIVVIFAIVYYSRRLSEDEWLLRVALGLQLGGAIGNLLDRVRLGHVIDFIDIGFGTTRWYTSNLADVSIVLGVILLGLSMLRDERRSRRAAAKSETPGVPN